MKSFKRVTSPENVSVQLKVLQKEIIIIKKNNTKKKIKKKINK